jgi:hypothetical protein
MLESVIMRRGLLLLLAATLAWTLACNLLAPGAPTAPATALAVPSSLPAPSATTAPPSATPPPTAAPTESPTLAPTPTAAATATTAGDYQLRPENVRFHPDPDLYSGDIVSIEVVAEDAPRNWEGARVWVYLDERGETPLAAGHFGRYGLGGRLQATFTWVWDTQGLEGPQALVVVVAPRAGEGGDPPAEQEVVLNVPLLPAETRLAPEPEARWAQAESACCLFHYLTGTAAARDIDLIRAEADAAFAHAAEVLGVTQQRKVVFNLVSRLLGHGGFASSEITLSYLDRNPAVTELFSIFAHEGTHILDRGLAQTKPTLLTEGLAVFVAGGHFKREPLAERAAAAVVLNRYIPLTALANGFYPAQHEIGYLQAGAFIHYLVERDGWDRFLGMYASFQPATSDAQMLDAGLRAHYGLTLDEMEVEWLEYLGGLEPSAAEVEDVRLTVDLFDTLRRYQQLKDPSAYFLAAWLPDGPGARQRGIVADFVRHPRAPDNIALEVMLTAAGEALQAGDVARAGALLEAVTAALDAGDLLAAPLAADHLHIVHELLASGYEAQGMRLDAQMAEVAAIREWPRLDTLTLVRAAGGWQLLAGGRALSRPRLAGAAP